MTIADLIDKIRHNAIAKDSSWAVIGSAMGRGLSMVAGIVIARLLGAEVYGEYGMIKSTLAYVAAFSTFGLGYTATKYIAQCKSDNPVAIGRIIASSTNITLTMSCIMAALLLLFADKIASNPNIVPALRYTALLIVCNAVNTTQQGLLAGFKDFRTIAINNTIVGIITFVLASLLTYRFGLDGALAALFISMLIQCILNQFAVRRLYRSIAHAAGLTGTIGFKQMGERWALTKELIVFSFPIALQECVYAASCWLRLFLIARLAGYDELGLYTAADQWFIMILFVPGMLRNVILSHLSSSADDRRTHTQTFSLMLKINIAATAIPAAIIAIGSPIICDMYGHSFNGFTIVLLIAVVTSIFGCIANVYTQEFISRGKNWILLLGYIVRDFGSLAIATPFLFWYGAQYGAAIAYLGVLTTHVIYCIILNRIYKYEFNRNL